MISRADKTLFFYYRTDFLVFSPRMSKNANPLLISTVATIAYTVWMEYTASHNDRFPYPFLGERPSTTAELLPGAPS